MEELILKLKKNNISISVIEDRLKLNIPDKLDASDILKEVKENKQDLISYIRQLTDDVYALKPVKKMAYYDASISQQASLLATLFRNPEEKYEYTFNIDRTLEVRDANIPALKRAFSILIERHEVLRTVLVLVNNEVKQKVLAPHELDWELVQLDARDSENVEDYVKELKSEPVIFDFEKGPLFDLRLVQVEDNKHLLIFTIHHSISDKWSIGIIEKELTHIYSELLSGRNPSLPPVEIHFKDYVHWTSRMIARDDANSHQLYWFNKLRELPARNIETELGHAKSPNLGLTYKEKLRKELREGQGYRTMTPEEEENFFGVLAIIEFRKGYRYDYTEGHEVLNTLKKLASATNTSVSVTVVAIFSLLLSRVTKEPDTIIALNRMLRENGNLKDVIGMMTNTIFFRNRADKSLTVEDFVKVVDENLLEAYDHSLYPVETLINNLDKPLHAISKVFLNVMNVEDTTLTIDMYLNGPDNTVCHPYFDMDFGVLIYDNGIKIQCSYVSGLYTADTLKYIFEEFDGLIKSIEQDPDILVAEVI